ncbi:hypothetical protein ABFV83_19445 [Lacrimispora sp. BS-2]|uniref:Capsular polysaccharide biosynthesis protein n=1 Tax=Lacrimispora sp. BS-2 TaxID=3151850 RepID=A0AAU7PNJ6_9FIRM
MNNTYEQEIDLKDLIFHILKRWRSVLFIAVVLAVLMGGSKFGQGALKYQDKQYLAELQETYDTDLMNYRVTKEGYERNIETLTQNIDYEEKYEKNSVLFKLDPYNKWVAKMDLFLKINEEKGVITMVDPADSLVKAYSSILRSESSLKEASKENDIETRYLRELINIEENIDGNMITVSVTYKDGEGAQKILGNILEGVNARQSELKDSLGPHRVILMNGETSMVADQELAESQNKRVDSFSEMQTSLKEVQLSLDELEEPQAPTGLSFKGVLKSAAKYGILGAVLGGFLTAFFWCVIYVINPRLHSAEEFKNRFGVKILGAFFQEGKEKKNLGIDAWFEKLEGKESVSREDVLKRIIANISIYMEKERTVLLTGTAELDILRSIETELKDSFPGVSFEVRADMNRNPETLIALPAADGVILVEKCGVSKYKDIEDELETIYDLNKKIIGCIIL